MVNLISLERMQRNFLQLKPFTRTVPIFRSIGYPFLLDGQRLRQTNPRPLDIWSNALTTRPCAPRINDSSGGRTCAMTHARTHCNLCPQVIAEMAQGSRTMINNQQCKQVVDSPMYRGVLHGRICYQIAQQSRKSERLQD